MKKKLILTMLILMVIVIPASAYDKASNNYVQQAKNIMLVGQGFNSDDTSDYEDGIVINILDFRGAKWFISITSDDGTFLSGVFKVTSAYKSASSWFSGCLTNNETGEDLDLAISFDDNSIYISFSSPNKGEEIDLPYDSFSIHKDNPEAAIYVTDIRTCFDMSNPSWKAATPKQLQKCISQNPYLRKL